MAQRTGQDFEKRLHSLEFTVSGFARHPLVMRERSTVHRWCKGDGSNIPESIWNLLDWIDIGKADRK